MFGVTFRPRGMTIGGHFYVLGGRHSLDRPGCRIFGPELRPDPHTDTFNPLAAVAPHIPAGGNVNTARWAGWRGV